MSDTEEIFSLWKGWVANGKKNGVPTYTINAQAPGGDPGNLYDFPINSPGLYNSYFNVCGNDDPNSELDKDKTPDDIHNLFDNIASAHDVSIASIL